MINNVALGIGNWSLRIGDWALCIGPNPQPPIPKTQFLIINFFIKKKINK